MPTPVVKKFTYQKASAELYIEGNQARLRGLYSRERSKGQASSLVYLITKYADDNGICLFLVVQRFGYGGRPGLNNDQLVAFYQKFGFKVIPNPAKFVIMRRDAAGASQEKQGL